MTIELDKLPSGANDTSSPKLCKHCGEFIRETHAVWYRNEWKHANTSRIFCSGAATCAWPEYITSTAPTNPVTDDSTLASYRAGLLCGLETAAQWLEKHGNSVYAIRIRAIKDEEILVGGTK